MTIRGVVGIALGGPDDPFPDFPSTTSAAARRHYAETGEAQVIYTYGPDVIQFIETHCVLTDSHYAGQPFRLMDWQKRALLEMFEVRKVRGEWLRRFRWSFIGIPKKNGKTELASALGVYLATADGESSAKVVCAAASDEQAGLLFDAASKICDWSESLSLFTDIKHKHIEFDTGETAPGELRRVAAVAGSNDGKNLSAVLIDELHEWVVPKSRAVFNVLTQGGGARREPFNIMITTAGSDEDSVCYEMYENGCAIRDGDLVDDTFYFLWFEADPDADYRDPATWEAANPSWGLILKQEFYEDIITKRSESEFSRYFLNKWMEADEIWEAAQFWPGLYDPKMELDPELPAYVGIDIGRRHDSSAIIICQWTGEHLLVKPKFWMNPHPIGHSRYQEWALNVMELEEYLMKTFHDFPEPALVDEEGYREPGPKYLYDPHFFIRSADVLAGEGLSMVEFPQSDSKMVPASQNLFELIKTGAVKHDGNKQMERQIRSVVSKQKERGWRISRPEGSRKKVDGAIALAMAAYAASAEFEEFDEPFQIF